MDNEIKKLIKGLEKNIKILADSERTMGLLEIAYHMNDLLYKLESILTEASIDGLDIAEETQRRLSETVKLSGGTSNYETPPKDKEKLFNWIIDCLHLVHNNTSNNFEGLFPLLEQFRPNTSIELDELVRQLYHKAQLGFQDCALTRKDIKNQFKQILEGNK